MALLSLTPYDRSFYEEQLSDFLPDKFIDCHNHIWLSRFVTGQDNAGRSCAWTKMVAKDKSIEDLIQINLDLFPGKTVIPFLYSYVNVAVDIKQSNANVKQCAKTHRFPALYLSRPDEPFEEIEKNVISGGFCGLKVYLDLPLLHSY